jgi:hypothetical protein
MEEENAQTRPCVPSISAVGTILQCYPDLQKALCVPTDNPSILPKNPEFLAQTSGRQTLALKLYRWSNDSEENRKERA